MPGMAKAARRKLDKKYPKKLDAIFDWHSPGMTGLITSNKDGTPGVQFVIDCDHATFQRYREAIEPATEARVRESEMLCAVDIFSPRGPVGRLTANIVIAPLGAILRAGGHTEVAIHLVHGRPDGDTVLLRLPVTVDEVTDEEFHGEWVEVGSGEHVAVTMNAHDGTLFVHRFETKEEAEAQLERNIAANEPFVGAQAN